MSLDVFEQIQGLSKDISSLTCELEEQRGVYESLKADFVTLINEQPVTVSSESYLSLSSRLDFLRKTFKSALEHLDTITDNAQSRLNDEHVTSHKGIYSLPPEMLSEIFKTGHEDNPQNEHAFNVSQVSRRFRNVAIHTPEIWSCLWPMNSWFHTTLFIERSKSVGLTIHIQASARLKKFMAITSQHCERWRNVLIDLREEVCRIVDPINDFEAFDEYVLRLQSIPRCLTLPRLVSLELKLPLSVLDSPFFTWEMPNIRHFNGICSHIPSNTRSVTNCSFRYFSKNNAKSYINISMLVNFFENIPRCESLTLFDWDVRTQIIKNPAFSDTLPYLRHLSLHGSSKFLRSLFDRCISAKKLVSLVFSTVDSDGASDLLAETPFDNLQKLIIKSGPSDRSNFTLNIKQFPVLKELVISRFSSVPVSFQHTQDAILQLSTLSLDYCPHINPQWIENFLDVWDTDEPTVNCTLRLMNCALPDNVIKKAESKLQGKFQWSK